MSGIVGSYFNTRGSGVVAKLGTDGQVFTSTGAGLSQGFEAAAGGGKIGQVVTSGAVTTEQGITSGSLVDITSLTVSITPAATSSKVLIHLTIPYKGPSSLYYGVITVLRDATDLGDASLGFCRIDDNESATQQDVASFHYVDSPSSVSAITYKAQGLAQSDTFYTSSQDCPSTLTVMEVLA